MHIKGTLDAMLHGSLWDPEPDVKQNVTAYVNEVGKEHPPCHAFCKPCGHFLILYRSLAYSNPRGSGYTLLIVSHISFGPY